MASQGISFIHGGEEFGRTKAAAKNDKESPIHNTYKTTTGANDFKWDLKAGDWKKVNEAYAAYIKMRKDHPAFRMTKADQILKNVDLDKASTDSVVIINIDGHAVKDSWDKIKVVMNSTKDAKSVANVEGWTKVADGYTVGEDVVQQNSSAAPQAMSIWITKADEADTTKQFESMYIHSNFTGKNWPAKAMTYSNGKWTSPVFRCDDAEILKFLVTTDGETFDDGQKWGLGEGSTLAKGGDDVSVGACTGPFKITVDDKTMVWSRVSANDNEVPEKWHTSMYIRGAFVGNWQHAGNMSYNNGAWESGIYPCGSTDDAKMFKILTDGSDWNDDLVTVWVGGDGNKLIFDYENAPNIIANCNGQFKVIVDDQTMRWETVNAN
jgi:hypothetical protein